MEFVLRVVEDEKRLANPDLKRFSLVFTSDDGDLIIRGFLYNIAGREVLPPSIMLARRQYDVVTLSATIREELQYQFYRRDQFPSRNRDTAVNRLKKQGFVRRELSDGGR